jgi:DNA-binding CsgD family transcriptional regulator
MHKNFINIGIAEPSNIIYEGLLNILHDFDINVNIHKVNNLNKFDEEISKANFSIIIINPVLVLNKEKEFKKLKKSFQNIHWIAIVYSIFEHELLSLFEDIIFINDSAETIYKLVDKFGDKKVDDNLAKQQELLSDREIDVLIQLVSGLSNKEIADKLNISIHTVISHRKNISLKTGIKSQSGLTIYAITKNIISLDKL